MIKTFNRQPMSIATAMLIGCLLPLTLFSQNQKDSLYAADLLTTSKKLTSEQQYQASNEKALESIGAFKNLAIWKKCISGYFQIVSNGLRSKDYSTTISLLENGKSKIPEEQVQVLKKLNTYLGYVYNQSGDIFSSMSAYEATIIPSITTKDTTNLVKAYGNIGLGYIQLREHAKAINYLNNAIVLGQQATDTDTMALWRNLKLLGNAYFYKNDLNQATKTYTQAQQLYDREDGTFECYTAEIQLERDQFDAALQSIEKAIQRSKAVDQDSEEDLMTFRKLQGEIYLQKQEPQKALRYFQQTLPLYQKAGNQRELGKLYVQIAHAQKQLQQYDTALSSYQMALTTFLPQFKSEDPTSNPSENQWSREIWLMEIFKGKGDCFFKRYQQTQLEKWLFLAEKNDDLTIQFIHYLKLNFDESESKLSLGSYTHPLYEKVIQTKWTLFEHSKNQKYLAEAFQIAQKANAFVLREMLSEQKALMISGVPKDTLVLLKQLSVQLTSIRQQLEQSPAQKKDAFQQAVFDTQQKIYNLKKTIEKNHPVFAALRNDLEVPNIQEVQQTLDSSRILLKYFLGTEKLYVFSISHKAMHLSQMDLPANFHHLINQYRKCIGDLDFVKDSTAIAEQTFLRVAHQLYQLLLEKPLAQHVPSTSFNRLTIVADGLLNTIPFQPLLMRESNSWTNPDPFLIARYAIGYAYFCKMLLDRSEPLFQSGDLMAFGLEFDDYTLQHLQKIAKDSIKNKAIQENLRSGKLSKLPFSDDEAREVAELMGGQSWLNEQASKTNFLTHAQDASMLHIATHSILDEEHPEQSALIFIKKRDTLDNLLRLDEIYNLRFNANMVVLSACNTGFGYDQKGEGINSLARAFNFSGIPSVTATFWNISDEVSKKVMNLNYQFLKKGLPKDIALQQAQLEFLRNDQISSPAFRLPVYWAAWMTIGEQEPLPQNRYYYLFIVFLLAIASVLFLLYRRSLL